nr:DEAD-box ATP-dependent RNA helicase 42-like [Megalopta genalis]
MKGIISLLLATLIISARGDSLEKLEWDIFEKLRQEIEQKIEKAQALLHELRIELEPPARSNYEKFLVYKQLNHDVESNSETVDDWKLGDPPSLLALLENDDTDDNDDSRTGDVGGAGSLSQNKDESPVKNRRRRSSPGGNRIEQNSSDSDENSNDSDGNDDNSSEEESRRKRRGSNGSNYGKGNSEEKSSDESDSSDDKSDDSDSNEKKPKDSRKIKSERRSDESDSDDRSDDSDETKDSKDSRRDKSKDKSSDESSESDSSDDDKPRWHDHRRKGGKDTENDRSDNRRRVEHDRNDKRNRWNLNGGDDRSDNEIPAPWYRRPDLASRWEARKEEFKKRFRQIVELRKVIESLENRASGYDDRVRRERIAILIRVMTVKKQFLEQKLDIVRRICNIASDDDLQRIFEQIDRCKINYNRLSSEWLNDGKPTFENGKPGARNDTALREFLAARRKFYEAKKLQQNQNVSETNSIVDTDAGPVVVVVVDELGDQDKTVAEGEEEQVKGVHPSDSQADVNAESSVNKEVQIEAAEASSNGESSSGEKNSSVSNVVQSAISISSGTINAAGSDAVPPNDENEISNDDRPGDGGKGQPQDSDPKSDKPNNSDRGSQGDKTGNNGSVDQNNESPGDTEIQGASDVGQIAVSIDTVESSANRTQNSTAESEARSYSKTGESSLVGNDEIAIAVAGRPDESSANNETNVSIETISTTSTSSSVSDGEDAETGEPESSSVSAIEEVIVPDAESDNSGSKVIFNTIGPESTPLIDE